MPAIPRITGLLLLLVLLSGCGGGGGGASADPTGPPASAGSPPVTSPPVVPATPTVNRPPVLVKPTGGIGAIVARELRYDASQAGTTYMDPDGDPLTYSVSIPSRNYSATGELIVYTPSFPEAIRASIIASDGRGGEAADQFDIFSRLNSPPLLVRPNGVIITTVGAHVNHDLTQGG